VCNMIMTFTCGFKCSKHVSLCFWVPHEISNCKLHVRLCMGQCRIYFTMLTLIIHVSILGVCIAYVGDYIGIYYIATQVQAGGCGGGFVDA